MDLKHLFLRKTMSGSLIAVTLLICVTLTFGRSITKMSLPSSARPGHVVALLPQESTNYEISDSSNGEISRLFSVLKGGQLITTMDLNTFLGRKLNFHVKCKHANDPWQQFYSIDIVRPSEMRQHFIGQPFRGFLSENEPLGSLVGGLEDLYENLKNFEDLADLQIVRGHKDSFHVQNFLPFTKPKIVSKALMDRENKTKYHITLKGLMKDGAEALASVFVNVKDANDNKPSFTKLKYVATVPMNTDSSSVIAKIHATDPDDDDVITYSVENNDFINVRPLTGEVTLKDGAKLQEKSYEFKLEATDKAGNRGKPAVLHMEAFIPKVTVASDTQVHHRRLRRATVDVRDELTFVVSRTTQGEVFTVSNTNPTCSEVYALMDPSPNEVIIDSNTGMVSLVGTFNESVSEVQFTVNVTCADDANFADTQLVTLKVVDRGNFDPIFSNEPYPIRLLLSYWTRPYSPLITLRSMDAEMGADVRYVVESGARGRFMVDAMTGEFRTNGRMPFDCTSPFQVAVSAQAARASPRNTHTPSQVIEVYCDQDLPPQFNRPEYNVSMNEKTLTTEVVVSMAAKSFHELPLRYSIESEPGRPLMFEIDSITGDVQPLQELSRVFDPWRYVMTVTASEVGSSYSTSTRLVINLQDINDHTPMFPAEVYVSTDIPENAAMGTTVVTLTVIDHDAGDFGRVTFETDQSLFGIVQDPDGDGKTGTLVVTGPLDYDLNPTRNYKVTVRATDGGGLVGVTTVEVWPVNVNDNSPIMEPDDQRIWLKETARDGTLVHILQGYDLDGDGLRFRFNANSPTRWGIFELNQNTGEIRLTESLSNIAQLDRYTIPIIVEDDSSCCPGQPVRTNIGEGVVNVDFIVVNTPPAFLECGSYKPDFKEGEPIRTGVINVTATDSDAGSNGELTYSLIYNEETPVFGIRDLPRQNGPYTAEIYSLAVFNRTYPNLGHTFYKVAGQMVYPITVQAQDNGRPQLSTTCFFLITIEDINDNTPKFDSTSYSAKIRDNSAVDTRVIRVYAYDEDQGENARVTYTFETPTSLFTINPNDGVIEVAGDVSSSGVVTLTVRGQDNGEPPLHSTVQVTIEVVSSDSELNPTWQEADNQPIDDLVLTIKEGNPAYFTFEQNFVASGSRQSGITYYIPPGPIDRLNKDFTFVQRWEENTNFMQVEVTEILDYEEVPDYLVTLRASWVDRDSSVNARLQIEVEDVNDNRPFFIGLDGNGKFPAAAPEDQPGPLNISVVFAIDLDGTSPFNNVEYYFTDSCQQGECSQFQLDRVTGRIISRPGVVFSRATKSSYTLFVIAMDGDDTMDPDDRHTTSPILVQVIITGSSMNPPRFTEPSYAFNVDPGLQFNTTIGQLQAEVPDPDMNYPQYGITEGNEKHLFAVNSETGRIYGVGFLLPQAPNDRDFTVTYRVFDGYEVNITTTVTIRLNDINIFPPRFDDPSYEIDRIHVEEREINGVMLNATAIDPETGTTGLSYGASGNLYTPQRFTIRQNGVRAEVLVPQPLDRDFPNGYGNWQINLEAQDPSNAKGYSVMNLRLIDINDNTPIFDTCCLTGHVKEQSIDSQFLRVFAYDYDEGDNARVTFRLVDSEDMFTIDPNTGWISNTQSFDREARDRYEINVEASDNPTSGEPALTVTQTIDVIVDDINNNEPRFRQQTYELAMPEELPIDASVTWVMADDADIGENARLAYSVQQGQDGAYFYMDSIYAAGTGVVKMNQRVDYDAPNNVRTLTFNVRVQDPDPTHDDIATVIITVYDVNDNAPVFDNPNREVTVPEDAAVGTEVVAGFTATDIDSGENATFNFYIDYENSDPLFNFEIDDDTGRVTVKSTLDWDVNNGQELQVLAIDHGTPPMTGTATVTINIDDLNNHSPMVELPDYPPVVLREYSSLGATIASLTIIDKDSPAYGQPFVIDAELTQCSEPFCQDLRFAIQGDQLIVRNNKNQYTRESSKAYYPVIPISDTNNSPGSLTGTSTLTILIADTNAYPPVAGTKTITAYNYRGMYNDVFIGRVFVDEPDDWDIADKDYEFVENYEGFELRGHGDIYMMSGATSSFLSVKVFDRVHQDEVICSVRVNVIYIDENAVKSSGSFRFQGITSEEFLNAGKIDNLRTVLSEVLNTDQQNIDIFTVQENPDVRDQIFVRYSAHGSPYYRPTRLDGRAQLSKETIQNQVGLEMLQAPIDECLTTQCWDGGCTNDLVIRDEPLTVNGNRTSLVGVYAYIEGKCTCGARDFSSVPANPQTCYADSCLNGGTCTETWADVICTCLEGFEGPRCQQLRHSFPGNGWAWYNPLETCKEDVLSLDIATQDNDGLILYQGPMFDTGANELRDFISLELTGGYPKLRLNLGDGELPLTITGRDSGGNVVVPPLSDGQWHNIEVIRQGMEVRLIVDRCKSETITESLSSTTSDRSACEVKGTVPGFRFVLRGTNPLQLGGRKSATSYPADIPDSGFNGCVKDVRHNGVLYDLHVGERGEHENTQDGCAREDDQCGACPTNSTCSAGLSTQRVCTCNPGRRGTACDIETTSRSFFEEGHFMEWSLADSFNSSLSTEMNELQVMFRTRQSDGVVFEAASFSKLEHVKIVLRDSRLYLLFDLGADERALFLNVNASDGQWHTVKVLRQGNQVILTMDGGDGRYFAERLPAEEHRLLALSGQQLFGGADVSYNRFLAEAQVDRTLLESCINDIRYDTVYFPMTESENNEINNVNLVNDNARQGCESPDVCGSVNCPPTFICVNAWMVAYCGCEAGFRVIGGSCVRILTCGDQPCLHDGTCVERPGFGVECLCPVGYGGEFCNLAPSTDDGLGAAAIAGAVIGSIAFLLLLILLIILLLRRRKKQPLLIDEPDDDIRENVVFYDEEGAGEEDMLAFDISRLQKPIDGDDLSVQKNNMMFAANAPLRREERPLGLAAEPMTAPRFPQVGPDGKYPHIGDFIDDRLGDADYDPNAPPYDSVREYQYEGSNSINGSLSSLNSSSSASEQDYDYLNNWGPRFAKLAEMYGGGEDEDEEDASSV